MPFLQLLLRTAVSADAAAAAVAAAARVTITTGSPATAAAPVEEEDCTLTYLTPGPNVQPTICFYNTKLAWDIYTPCYFIKQCVPFVL